MTKKLKPFIKWPGGKTEELRIIKEYMPNIKGRYIEPFVGGGAVFFVIGNGYEKIINDKSDELILLYKLIKANDQEFFNVLYSMDRIWSNIRVFTEENYSQLSMIYLNYRADNLSEDDLEKEIEEYIDKNNEYIRILALETLEIQDNILIKEMNKNLKRKYKRMKKIEKEKGLMEEKDIFDNIESAKKSSYYMYIRYLYNNIDKLKINKSKEGAIFYFIREYCYSSMFRYNNSGGFNVPYGGISYNKKQLKTKVDCMRSEAYINYLKDTNLYCLDFEEFFKKIKPNSNDFIFLDPPYDSDFSTYAKMKFGKEDQIRLADSLKSIDSKFMLVIKNTEFIYELYKNFNIIKFDKNYSVSFQNRNEKEVEHLLIKNY